MVCECKSCQSEVVLAVIVLAVCVCLWWRSGLIKTLSCSPMPFINKEVDSSTFVNMCHIGALDFHFRKLLPHQTAARESWQVMVNVITAPISSTVCSICLAILLWVCCLGGNSQKDYSQRKKSDENRARFSDGREKERYLDITHHRTKDETMPSNLAKQSNSPRCSHIFSSVVK